MFTEEDLSLSNFLIAGAILGGAILVLWLWHGVQRNKQPDPDPDKNLNLKQPAKSD